MLKGSGGPLELSETRLLAQALLTAYRVVETRGDQ